MSRFDDYIRTITTNFRQMYKNTTTERIAVNYLIYRHPIKHFVVTLPFVVGYIMMSIFIPTISEKMGLQQLDLIYIDIFHQGFQLAMVVLLAMFLLFRWINIRQDGSYGYWISLGINRAIFITILMAKFVYYILISYGLGLVILTQFAGIDLSLSHLAIQFVQVIATTVLLLGIALLISEFISSSPVSIIIFLTVAFLAMSDSSIPLFGVLNLRNYGLINSFVILAQLAFGTLFLFITVYIHDRAEFDLR